MLKAKHERETRVSDLTQSQGEEMTKHSRYSQKRQSRVVGDMMTTFEEQRHRQSRADECIVALLEAQQLGQVGH